ncbi:site-specific integrase [Hufsiella ginkgonis]|uniref:Tyrosine-type recombinase/integrase n=1 Tax=Hufsiella ginkgonis TaxID=2695274 RepID=A0A7K1XZV6_9SPHI|nr:site-specific integrase [Hufsiella ginkgonis]MXV16555.1 tyrosine-type recombinase/integrase [Hufsiella ginkgonis]
MKRTFKVLFFVRKPKNYSDGTVPIYLRLTVDGERVEWHTQRECDPERWNAQAGRMIGTKQDAKSVNAWLEQLHVQVFDTQRHLAHMGKEPTALAIRNKIQGKGDEKVHTLIEVFEYHNEQFAQLVGKDFAPGTLKKFKTALAALQNFITWKFSVRDVAITQVNHQFITDYEFYLKSIHGVQHNTAMGMIKKLKKIIRQCVANDWLAKDPFLSYKIKTRETHRAFLLEKDLELLANKHFPTDRLNLVKDLFLFSCFTGLSYSDVAELSSTDIAIGIDREMWIHTRRTKTDTNSRIPLLPTALSIIEKYKDHPKVQAEGRLFPCISNQRMNSYLKEISDCLGLQKELTFHCARHTFATTVTLTNGVPIETVSKMLGHRSLRTTQQYAKILDVKVSNDMQVLKDRFAIKAGTKSAI